PTHDSGACMPALRRAGWIIAFRPLAAFGPLRPARIALAAGALFSALVLLCAGLLLWYERSEELRYAQRDTANPSHTLSEHLSQTLDTIDLGLKAGLSQLHEPQPAAADDGRNTRILRAHANALVSITGIGLYGTQGEPIAGSTADAGVLPHTLAGTETLAAHASGKAMGLHVSAPTRIGPDAEWQLVLSRALVGPGGQFRGVIAALFDLRSLAETYRSIDLGAHGSVVLLGWNGALLAVYPWREDVVGEPFLDPSVLADATAEATASVELRRSPLNGRRVIAANTSLRGYPLTLSLMVDRSSVLAPWRRQAAIEGGAALLISALALTLA